MYTPTTLLHHLDEREVSYTKTDHPAVFTVEEAQLHTQHLPGAHVKNLFLTGKDGSNWLVTCPDEQPVKVNGLSRLLGAPRFSFAKPEVLMSVLGVQPGSVTPLALINDTQRSVKFVLDQKLTSATMVNVHPLTNTATISIRPDDLVDFVKNLGYEPILVDLSASLTA